MARRAASRVVDPSSSPRAVVARQIARRLFGAGVVANLAGAGVVLLFLGVVFRPPSEVQASASLGMTAAALAGFAVVGTVAGIAWVVSHTRTLWAWAQTEEPPTDDVRRQVLALPLVAVRLTVLQWGAALVVFSALTLDDSVLFAIETAITLLLGGLVTGAAAWRFVERELRPAVAIVLSSKAPPEVSALGIGPRILITWLLCSGVPLIGVGLVPLGREDASASSLVAPIAFVVVVAFVTGGLLMTLAMRSVADPVREVGRGMEAVANGSTSVRVTVDDASEVGSLQAGFNAMVVGLAERERLHDLFRRQVGEDVARRALERGAKLGGAQRTVGVLFVDVIGSTQLATRETPERVVGKLNDFFSIVVATVVAHGGFVNKFEGDGALCVFGAPVSTDRIPDRTLAAARDLAERLYDEGPLDAAIGVSCGTAVAGHVGAESRYEYTVIGDPVNEAARLTDLAKGRPGRILASAATVRQAAEEEQVHWRDDGDAVLRGRPEPTELAVPAYTRESPPE